MLLKFIHNRNIVYILFTCNKKQLKKKMFRLKIIHVKKIALNKFCFIVHIIFISDFKSRLCKQHKGFKVKKTYS